MNRMISVLVLCVAAGCAGGAYLGAAGRFATTTAENVGVLQGMTGVRGTLCHKNAQYDYAFHRMGGPVVKPGESDPITILDYETRFPYKASTWSKLCSENDASDKIVQKALLAIAAYSDAMNTIAAVNFDGKDVKSLGSDAATLIGAVGATNASTIAKSLVDPITSVAGALEKHYAAKKVAEVVAASDTSITALLGGIDSYLGAVGAESKLTRHTLEDTLKRADRTIEPAGTVEYVDLAMRWVSDLDSIDDAIAASRDALKKLADAQAKLRGAGGRDDAPELKALLGDLTTVLGDIEAVRVAIAGKGGK